MTTVNYDKKSAKKSLIFGAIGVAVLGLLYIYSEYIEPNQIKSDFSLTTGIITEAGRKGMRDLKEPTIFEYNVDGKKYEGQFTNLMPCNFEGDLSNELLAFNYTIVYSNKSPEKARLLTTPELFADYGLTMDDDTKMIFNKFWDCK